MRVDKARIIARQWVASAVATGFPISGAFLHGSITWLDDSDEIAPESDIDLLVIPLPGHAIPARDKLEIEGLVLDVSPLAPEQLDTAENVLGSYHLAGSLRSASAILYDQTGRLTAIQQDVGRRFAEPIWIERRVDSAVDRIESYLELLTAASSREDRLLAWLFAAGVTTHVLLTGGLRNPTVRNRYPATRSMLSSLRRPELYAPLIDLLDPNHADAAHVTRFVDLLAPLFDLASVRSTTWFHFSEDLSPLGRVGAIDASRRLIAEGQPRDALFWLGVTSARCMTVLNADGTETDRARFDPFLDELARWFRVDSADAATDRANTLQASLPAIRANALSLIPVTT